MAGIAHQQRLYGCSLGALALAGCWPAAVQAAAPSVPMLVAPAAGATLNASSPQIFTTRATDPDGDAYSTEITVLDSLGRVFTRFSSVLSPSGADSSGSPGVPLPAGRYTWSARASDVGGATSGSSGGRSVTVAGAPDAGGGAVSGEISFSQAVPVAGQPCAPTQFALHATSAAAVVSLEQAVFAGPVTIEGSGGSSCESATTGSGTLTVAARGLGATGISADCPVLTGPYVRTGHDVTATLSGDCTLAGWATDSVVFYAKAAFAPTEPGAGVTAPIAEAIFDGGFAVAPGT